MAKGMVQARKKKARRASKEAYKNRFQKPKGVSFAPKTWKSKKKKSSLVVEYPSSKTNSPKRTNGPSRSLSNHTEKQHKS